MRNQKWPIFKECSNSMVTDSTQVLPLKKHKLQNKFRNISHEKLTKGLNPVSLTKESNKIQLKKENSNPLEDKDKKIEMNKKGSKEKPNLNSTSIFNVTFGCLKYSSPSNYKKKVKPKQKVENSSKF